MSELDFFRNYYKRKIRKYDEEQAKIPRDKKWADLFKPFKEVNFDLKLLKKVNNDIEYYLKNEALSAIWDSYRKYLLKVQKEFHLEIVKQHTRDDVQHTYLYYLHAVIEGLEHRVMIYDTCYGGDYIPAGMNFFELWYLLEKMEISLTKKYKFLIKCKSK